MILVDIIGMGGSTRVGDFDKETITPQESIDYFVSFLEKWRVNVGRYF